MTSTSAEAALDTAEPTVKTTESAPALLGRQRVTLGDGRVVAPARDREVFLAWGLDAVLVFLAALGLYLVLCLTTPAPFPCARELTALAGWPAAALVYGFATAYRRSIGQRIAGTRTLRIDTGGSLGFWRSGWMMVLRVLILPAAFVFCLCGGSTFGVKDRHLSIDALATGR